MPTITVLVQSSKGQKRYSIRTESLGTETYTMLRLQAYVSCLEAGYWSKASGDDSSISDDLMRMVETASTTIETANATAQQAQNIAIQMQRENSRLQAEIAQLRADNARLRSIPVRQQRPSPIPAFTIPVAPRPVASIDGGIAEGLDRVGTGAMPITPNATTTNPYANGGRDGNRPELEID